MLIIPAIDLKNGKCVRLLKGEEGTETIFSENPPEVAGRWESCGAKFIHVVDLDGAFTGEPKNFNVIKEIVNSISCPIQLGGGIRNLEIIETYLASGVNRVILGTAAFNDRKFLIEACAKFPGQIALGLDTKGGKIAVKGWTEVMDLDTATVLGQMKDIGVSIVIHTNVDRDGTMEGVNLASMKEFAKSSPLPVVASGGIASMEDLEKISTLEKDGVVGAILGKSIYTGKINLKDAIDRFE